MKVRIETADCDEIVIRCKKIDDKVKQLSETVKKAIFSGLEITATLNERSYRIHAGEVLFFESDNGKTALHTRSGMYYVGYRLFELENLLPPCFVRASKSCILNSENISSFSRSLSGVAEVSFTSSDKKVYVSRMYYKTFRERINEKENSL